MLNWIKYRNIEYLHLKDKAGKREIVRQSTQEEYLCIMCGYNNTLKYSGVRELHLKVFNAIQI